MADVWRYHFYQMQNGLPGFLSETFLFDLPLSQVTFSTILQQPGQWTASLLMSDPGVQDALKDQPPLHLLCDRTVMYVELNGHIVYGGILQQTSFDNTTNQVQLNGTDWWGYFNNERLITWNASYTSTEQMLIVADLINIAQGNASSTHQTPNLAAGTIVGGNVGVALGPNATAALAGSFTSGVDLTIAWAASSFKQLGTAVSDLATSSIGFDWTIDVTDVAGVPTKTFEIWYPRAGRTQQQQLGAGYSVTIDMGSSSGISYTWPCGSNQPANVMYGAGSGSGNVAISSVASNPALLDQGWPLMENSVSYCDITSQSLLDTLTQTHLDAAEYPISLPVLVYAAGSDATMPLGSYAIGDDIRLIIPPDPYFPNGYDSEGINDGEQWWRIQQIAATVNDQGKSTVQLTLGTPPVVPF